MNFKQKAKHFFYYYKWHVIITIFTVVMAGLLLKSCTSAKEPDVNIAYISDSAVSGETYDKLFEALKENNFVSDVNQDGETIFYFDPVVVGFDNSAEDYDSYQKLQVLLSSGSQTVMLSHQYALEDYEWGFDDIGKYAKPEDKTFTGTEGTVLGISVEGNKFLESIGINTENLYVSMHLRTEKQKEKNEFEKEYEHGYKILEFILENQ